MSTLLRSLKLMVGADFSQAQAGFKQAAKEFKAVGKDLTQTGSTLTKGVTMPIAAAAIASIKFASDLEESTNKVNVAFGDSADEVKKFADSSLKNFGIAKGSAMDMAATYGDMGTSMGLTSAKAAEMSTSLTGLAGDLASFKNIGLDQASEALRGVFTGEGEALKTLGVIMQDSTLEAYALANGYEKTYKNMSQAEKVAIRYKYVMEATKNAQGDFARTGGGVANQMRTVTESLKEAGAALGTQLLPKVAAGLQSLNGLISKFSGLDEGTKRTIITVAGLAAAMGPVLLIMGKMTTGLGNVMTAFSAATKAINSGAGMTGALSALVGPGGIALIAIGSIAALATGMVITKEKMEAAAKEARELSKAVDASIKAYEDSTKEIDANASVASKLTDELFALSNKENKSNIEKSKMISLVDQLNKLVPGLNLNINKQTGELDRNEKAIRDLIEAKKIELKLAATQNSLVEGYKEQVRLTDKVTEAQERLAEIKKKMAANPMGSSYYKAELKYAQDALDNATNAAKKNADQVRILEGVHDDLAVSTYNLGSALKSAGDAAGDAGADFAKLAADDMKFNEEWWKERSKKYDEQFEKEFETFSDYYKRLEDTTQEHYDQMGTLDDNGIKKSKLTADEVKRNLENQLKDFAKWREGIKVLSGKVPADVLAELEKLGPEMSLMILGDKKKGIKGLVDKTDTELAAWVRVWREKSGAAENSAIEELSSLPAALGKIGRDGGNSLASGLRSTESNILAASIEIGKTIPYGLRKLMDMHSPSKVMRKLGMYTGEGLALGIRDSVGLVKAATGEMASVAMSTPLGGRAIEPRATGMESVMPNIMNAVAASGASGGDWHFNFIVGNKTILDTVITEADRRNQRSGRKVITVGV